MQIKFRSRIFPIEIHILGDVSQIQYSWRIEPLLNIFDLHKFLIELKSLIKWSRLNNIICTYQAPIKYRMAISLLK